MMARAPIWFAVLAIGLSIGLSVDHGLTASLNGGSKPLTPYRTCTVTAVPSTTTAVTETNVRQLLTSSGSNFGASSTMDVVSALAANQRAYVRFDLAGCSPSIPASATLRVATLRLYLTALPTQCRTLDIFKVTAAWAETGITWNNQPFGTSINNPSSGSRTAFFNVGTPVGCTNRVAGYVTGATVTADVAAYVAGASTNLGWMIRDDAEGSLTAQTSTFSTKELANVAQAPQLVVTYVTVP